MQWAGAIFLAVVAGYLDGYGHLFLKTYVSFMSGNTTGGHLASAAGREPLMESHGEGDSHLKRAGMDASVLSGFIGGAVLSGMLHPSLRAWALLPPCVVMLVLSLFSDRTAPFAAGAVALHWHNGSVHFAPQESR